MRRFFAASASLVRLLAVISPKRRESRTAMGRAPMVKMSRRMPPTPGVAAKDLLNARVLLARDAMFGGDFGGHSNFGASSGHVSGLRQRFEAVGSAHAVALAAPTSASTMERKMTRPSEKPRAHSTARSGWGIKPATLRSRLQTPAMW